MDATPVEDHHMRDVDPLETEDDSGQTDQTSGPHSAATSYDDADTEPDSLALDQLKRRGLLPTGLCYDSRMKMHMNAEFSNNAHHPEDPRRIHEIFEAFKRAGLIYQGPPELAARVFKEMPTRYMWRIPARFALDEEICLAHTPAHLSWVKETENMSLAELRELTKRYDSTRESLYVGSLSCYAATLSAGGAVDTCKNVVAGNVKNAFAVIRPPGHHAEMDQPMGFCFFNNVPVAVRTCQKEYPETCRKVLILDWDVHHGNGIQNIFYDDPNVLYISLHVYMDGSFYPGRPENDEIPDGGIEHCGAGAGLGTNVNIGWHAQGMGDGEYMAAFQKIVMPIAQEFNPDLVVISAGFDAADGDELGACFVTPACYAHMTHMLMSLANGRLAVCLEGGYNLDAISNSAVAVARTLMGEPPPQMTIPKLNKEAARVLNKVQVYQSHYWQCMRPGVVDMALAQSNRSQRMHDFVRNAQKDVLMMKHHMVPLYIQREKLHRTFENQVLVTPTIETAGKVLIVIHDPPELLSQPDYGDHTRLELHNSFIVDGVTSYIDWARKEGFGVMDINVPNCAERTDNTGLLIPSVTPGELERQIASLMEWLWDNYIELYDADHIFLVGVGNAYLGVKMLLINRPCRERISGVVNFVNGNLRPVKSQTDDGLSPWYKQNSQVYVAADHNCWLDPSLTQKIEKRRFGTVVRSKESGLTRMMDAHAEDVQRWIRDRVSEEEESGDTTAESF